MRTWTLEWQPSRSSFHARIRIRSAVPGDAVRLASRSLLSRPALWTALLLFLALAVTQALGAAPAFQVSNVDAQPSGAVSMVVGVPTWSRAESPGFSLTLGENKNPVPASEVKRLDPPPLSLILCIDKSGSMRPAAMNGIKQGLQQLFQNPPQKVDVAMIGFGSATKRLSVFGTGAAGQLEAAKSIQLEGRESKTALYEAAAGAIAELKLRSGSKRVIVITDGQDEGSAITLEQLIKLASDAGIAVDVISTGQFAQQGVPAMERLTSATQGSLVKVANGANVGPELMSLVDNARKLGGTFQVAFKYEPAANEAPLQAATLALVGLGGEPATQPVRASFVPVAATVAATVVNTPPERRSILDLTVNFHFFDITIKSLISLLLGAGLLGAGVIYRERIVSFVRHIVHTIYIVVIKEEKTAAGPKPDTPLPGASPASTRIVRHTFAPPAPGRPTAILRGRSGVVGNLSFNIEKPLYRIGAAPNSDLRLNNDDFVSNDHATIRYASGSLYLADHGSRNGTFLNGTRVSQTMALSIGDQIRFGRSEVTVEAGASGRGGAIYEAADRVGEGSVR